MKHFPVLLISLFYVLSIQAADIWVSPQGADRNAGSQDAPKASLQSALRQARELRRLQDTSIDNGIRIIMQDGVYPLYETILIRPEDAGTAECPTVIQAASNAHPVLSGGLRITQWEELTIPVKGLQTVSKVWVSRVPKVGGQSIAFRQLYINGHKAMAATDTEDPEQMQRILAVDKEKREITIPAPACNFSRTDGMELFIHQMWEVAILRIKNIRIKGNEASLSFYEPESRLEFEHPWPPAVISEEGNSPFRLSRAIELMDKAGEWYYDEDKALLYYIPCENEDINNVEAIVPILETLVSVQGCIDRPVQYIGFQGIAFQHSTWLRPSQMGYVPLQAGMFLLDAYKLPIPGTPDKAALENQAWIGRQPAAVELSGVQHTFFEGCRFEHLGASGLDYQAASCNDRIEGCTFTDIAGSGLVVGKFSDPGIETHLPYLPKDLRELGRKMLVRNNYIMDCASEYWGCTGIIAGYVQEVNIEYNEVCELPYSGISVGWGWTRTTNCMNDNRIFANNVHHFGRHNYSCGGLYTLSAQTGTLIAENYVHDIYHPTYVHDKTQGHYIYLDEASSWMTIRDNWCTEAHFGQNQPGVNLWENNGPQVADSIRNRAGIQANWQYILAE